MSSPDVSIVVPAWGAYAGAPLLEALESLRAQDLDARIIVVDNASGKALDGLGGAAVVRADERLTVGAARNLGLEQVNTPYVLFWDADDLILPGTLRFLHDRLASDPGLVAVAASIMEDEPRVRHRWPPPWAARLAHRPRTFAVADAVWSLFPTTGSTLMRTEAAKASGGFGNSDSGEDWVLGVSLAFRGRVELHERPGRVYRRLGESLWEQRRSPRDLLGHAASVRRRIRSDPAVPGWARALSSMLAPAQALVLLGLGPLARQARSALRR